MARRTRRQVGLQDAFWDTSALVPLCKAEPLSNQAVKLYSTYQATIWWGTPTELHSALARLERFGQINSIELATAKMLLEDLASYWTNVLPSNTVQTQASSLLYRYDLRAADALQLAAALEWCEGEPAQRPFFTADAKLREAARLSGFDTSQF